MSISSYAIRRPLATSIFILLACLFGMFSLCRLPLTFLPEISRPNLAPQVNYRSTSPQDIARLITAPLEGVMGGLENLNSIATTSSASGATLRMEFQLGTDMKLAMAEIRDRIDQVRAQLPEDLGTVRIRRFQTTDQPIITFSIAGATDLTSLYEMAESVIVPRLLRIDGVADVGLSGIRDKEITVLLDEELLNGAGVTVSQVNRTLQANNVILSAGYLVEGGHRYVIRSLGELTVPEEIAQLRIGNSTARIGDVATVTVGLAEQTRFQRLNGRDAVAARIYKNSTANIVEVADLVHAVIDDLRAQSDGLDIGVFLTSRTDWTSACF